MAKTGEVKAKAIIRKLDIKNCSVKIEFFFLATTLATAHFYDKYCQKRVGL